jgi:methionyl-tRNA formyltransferase
MVLHSSIRGFGEVMLNSMRWVVLFGGAGRESCVLRMLDAGVKVSAIIVPSRRNAKLESAVSKLAGLPCKLIETDKVDLDRTLKIFAGNALLSIGFPYLLPSELLSNFNPAINIHPTLLPRYRGATSGAYVLINNDRESGSSVHYLTECMDRGDIIRQSRVEITPFDTIRSVQRKVYEREPQLLLDALDSLERGVKPSPQDESCASEYPHKRTPADSEIDPSAPLVNLFNQIRACDPDDFPAYFMFHGEKVCIKLWRPEKPVEDFDLI